MFSNIHLGHYRCQFLTRLVEKCILSKGCQESVWLFSGQRLIQKTVGETGCLPKQGGHSGRTKQHFHKQGLRKESSPLERAIRKTCEKGRVGAGREDRNLHLEFR